MVARPSKLGMARWEVSFAVERQRGVPLFQQIASAITTDIRRGRLRPGEALPGTRSLARALGVQRMTVVAAFDELVAEGWIVNLRALVSLDSRELQEGVRRLAACWPKPAAKP